MTKDKALKLALEALTYCETLNKDVEQQKMQAITAIKEALAQPDHIVDANKMAQPAQEPKVRTGDCLLCGVCASEGHKIQAQRPWVWLTDDEVEIAAWTDGSFGAGARWANAKLKGKNT